MLRSRSTRLAQEISEGRYRDGNTLMTPDGTVVWEHHTLPNNKGVLLLAPDSSPEVVRHLARAAFGRNWWLPGLRSGQSAQIRQYGNLAVKNFRRKSKFYDYSFETLQANVALQHGLQRINNVWGDWKFVAPTYHGALFRYKQRERRSWVMSHEEGKHPPAKTWYARQDTRVPGQITREKIFAAAVSACGVEPLLVSVDDSEKNTLVRTGTTTKFEAVKLDLFTVAAAPDSMPAYTRDQPALETK